MFLMHRPTGVLVEVLGLPEMFDPCQPEVRGRKHAGEELQDPEQFAKSELAFPSGEALPVCWVNAHYRDVQPTRKAGAAFAGLPL